MSGNYPGGLLDRRIGSVVERGRRGAQAPNERLRREHGTLSAQASQDPLTGLANRRAMQAALDALLRPDGAAFDVALALVDLDGLKQVNDAGSHAEGDEALRVYRATEADGNRVVAAAHP